MCPLLPFRLLYIQFLYLWGTIEVQHEQALYIKLTAGLKLRRSHFLGVDNTVRCLLQKICDRIVVTVTHCCYLHGFVNVAKPLGFHSVVEVIHCKEAKGKELTLHNWYQKVTVSSCCYIKRTNVCGKQPFTPVGKSIHCWVRTERKGPLFSLNVTVYFSSISSEQWTVTSLHNNYTGTFYWISLDEHPLFITFH